MVKALRRSSSGIALTFFLGLITVGLIGPAHANPVPFQATYELKIDGWPDARIHHRLSRQNDVWQSEMRAAISIAEGLERSRFRLDGDEVEPLTYVSSYRLLGLGERYHLTADDMAALPDRQTALFELSRQARTARCTHSQVAPCIVRYLDHEGDEETLKYRVVAREDVSLPVGTFPGIRVDTWEPGKRDRHLIMTFHADVPGLLLRMEYRRDGETPSHLTLAQLTLEADADQQR